MGEKRLIDVEDAIERAIKSDKIVGSSIWETSEVVEFLEDEPTVVAVEVVHGEWSTIEDDYTGLVALQCSVCNQEYWFEDEPPIKIYNYCPNCGAKMDGGKDSGM